MTATSEYKEKLRILAERDMAHDEKMATLAKRGGKTLAGMRRLKMEAKDEFIAQNKDEK